MRVMRGLAISKSMCGWLGALALSLLCPLGAQAEPTIQLSTYNLLPNTAGQVISVFVSGGDAVQAFNFNVTIQDAGAAYAGVYANGDPRLTAALPGPIITGINVLPTGSPFIASNVGQKG